MYTEHWPPLYTEHSLGCGATFPLIIVTAIVCRTCSRMWPYHPVSQRHSVTFSEVKPNASPDPPEIVPFVVKEIWNREDTNAGELRFILDLVSNIQNGECHVIHYTFSRKHEFNLKPDSRLHSRKPLSSEARQSISYGYSGRKRILAV